MTRSASLIATCMAALLFARAETAGAAMTLTLAGSSAGFTLTTFADGFPSSGGVGPVGIQVTSTGSVIVSSYAAGKNAVFATDTDGQHYSGAAISASSYSTPSGIAISGGIIYQVLQGPGVKLIKIDASGNFIATVVTGLTSATDVLVNPANGHLFISTPGVGNIWDYNPSTNTTSLFKSGVNFDGISIDAAGAKLSWREPFHW